MEVFLKNVPLLMTSETLTTELDSVMKALDIEDWTCDKPSRRALAWVTFLKTTEAARFLEAHGKVFAKTQAIKGGGVAMGRDMAKLYITKTPIYVEKSIRGVNQELLGHLEQRQQKRATRTARRAAQPDHVLPAFSVYFYKISCGTNVFRGDERQLTFAMQTTLNTFCTAKFIKRGITIIATSQFRFDIPSDTIVDFIVSRHTCTATLVLSEPPRFFQPFGETWYRKEACPTWSGHDEYSGRCLVYQFDIAITSALDKFVKSLKERDDISFTSHDLPVTLTPEPYLHEYRTSLKAFEGKMQELGSRSGQLPFPILFQLVALVWNNYLQPSSGHRMAVLMAKMAAGARAEGRSLPFTVESMKRLFTEIPYPVSGTGPDDLDVVSWVDKLVQIEADLHRDNPMRDPIYGIIIPDHQAWIMKAMVTPTRIVLLGPEAESKNRILRKFFNRTEYFLRCLFCDDDGQDLPFNPKVSNDAVYERFRSVLSNGIRIAGRRFDFLGFSHSSLRSHSVWSAATFTDDDFKQHKYEDIIRGLGNFEDIRVPAKCAARIGQAFSETPYAVPIFDAGIAIQYIPDVKTKDGSRVFSDGVGTISSEAMRELWRYLPARSSAATCFQIRWAGAKGMIALDPTIPGKVIRIRKESMVKFETNEIMEMGICDTASRPLRLWLNRQMIKILEDMGTNDQWFLNMQNKELRVLRAITAQARNTSTFLRYQLIGTSMGLPGLIRTLDRLGLDYRRDDFLKMVVEHVVLRELRLLKHKARIPVDKGVTLFGIMDETGYLSEDEIYITLDEADRIATPPRKGPCIITRSPALHPGDIRVVTMVTPPDDSPLRQLRNCVVFSRHGDRDLPSQMSGGDLDGDLYNIIWDMDAMPKKMFSPADYLRVTPQPLRRKVNRDDMADFFINFMKTDILGMIATRHQILADFKRDGTIDEECLKLAERHSTAVDSSKTGIPVDVRDLPKAPMKNLRPDFLSPAPPLKLHDIGQIAHIAEDEDEEGDDGDDMGTAKHRYYPSNKILGKLYRNVDENNIWQAYICQTNPDASHGNKTLWMDLLDAKAVRILMQLNGPFTCQYQRQLAEAWKIRNRYEAAIEDAMWQFSENPRKPITEVEVFCGFILNKRGSQTRRQRDSSIKLKEATEYIMEYTVKQIRETGPRRTEDEGGGDGIGIGIGIGIGTGRNEASANGEGGREGGEAVLTNEDVLELCLACLVVGCASDLKQESAYSGSGTLQSFKLVAASCLAKEMTSQGLFSPSDGDGGGGYVGVGGGPQIALPIR